MKKVFLVFIFLYLPLQAYGESKLSNKAIFYRCYKMLTESFPSPDHPSIAKVINNQMTPVDACLEIFDKAQFTANNNFRISNTSDVEAKRVLRAMHNLHLSWFRNKRLPSQTEPSNENAGDVLDYNGPALFFTKSLFDYDHQFKSIFSGNTVHYESDRTDNNPSKGATTKWGKLSPYSGEIGFPFPDIKFAAQGELLGVRTYTSKKFNRSADSLFGADVARYDLHWGGGVLGTHTYIQANIDEKSNYSTNGADRMFRKWGKNVFLDFLCRDQPVIRYQDAAPFTSSTSSIGFRQSTSCVRCHASMDRVSGVIRNVRPSTHIRAKSKSMSSLTTWDTSSSAEAQWPLEPIGYYYRPLNGVFYFRTHDGLLIDKNINSVEALGAEISKLESTYVCMAKRYYKYFTGVDANINDIADPQDKVILSVEDQEHRDQVIQMGKNLKNHQSLRALIKEILEKEQFSDAGFRLPTESDL